MPLKLILMRHAKSDWDDPLLVDHDRVLNKRGRASAVAMGNWLRAEGHVPDETLSSSSQRTRETQELVGMGGDVTFSKALYHAGSHKMLTALQAATGKTILMIGHNPGIGDFAERLAKQAAGHPRFFDYPTCATTVFEFDCTFWSEVQPGMGTVRAFMIPREILE